MSEIIKRTFICTGCGEARPCYLTTNQEKGEIEFYDHTENLKCVLDETNQTAPNWQEVQANGVDKCTEPALPIRDVSVSLFNEALRVMRDLAEHQNGAPLIRHEEEYNKTMAEVWDFLEANET